jgi:hypothetical protein
MTAKISNAKSTVPGFRCKPQKSGRQEHGKTHKLSAGINNNEWVQGKDKEQEGSKCAQWNYYCSLVENLSMSQLANRTKMQGKFTFKDRKPECNIKSSSAINRSKEEKRIQLENSYHKNKLLGVKSCKSKYSQIYLQETSAKKICQSTKHHQHQSDTQLKIQDSEPTQEELRQWLRGDVKTSDINRNTDHEHTQSSKVGHQRDGRSQSI